MFICLEIHGKGDPFFGGSADDRPLGVNGQFLTTVQTWSTKTALFATKQAAQAAGEKASRRAGSILSVFDAPWASERPERYAAT